MRLTTNRLKSKGSRPRGATKVTGIPNGQTMELIRPLRAHPARENNQAETKIEAIVRTNWVRMPTAIQGPEARLLDGTRSAITRIRPILSQQHRLLRALPWKRTASGAATAKSARSATMPNLSTLVLQAVEMRVVETNRLGPCIHTGYFRIVHVSISETEHDEFSENGPSAVTSEDSKQTRCKIKVEHMPNVFLFFFEQGQWYCLTVKTIMI